MIEEKSRLPGIFAGKFMQNVHRGFLWLCSGGFRANLENCCIAQQYILPFLVYYSTHTHTFDKQQEKRRKN